MKLSPSEKTNFNSYVESAKLAVEDLQFIFENIGRDVSRNLNRSDLVFFEDFLATDKFSDIEHLVNREDFSMLVGQYLGELIVAKTKGKWVQCIDKNENFAQPCIDQFGNKKWDRIYPVSLAINYGHIVSKQRNFPGSRDRTIFACQYDKALKISKN